MKRERIDEEGGARQPLPRSAREKIDGGGSYFAAPKSGLRFIKSGCKTLDLALGGGWVEGRIANIVGDKSTGKTLLAIEAAANFAAKYPKGRILYRECEAAFDKGYAAALGMPIERVDLDSPFETVEDFFEDLQEQVKVKIPTLYILDSLDALSDRGEMDRDMDEGSYGTAKAKLMSQLFRRLVRKMELAGLTLLVISQVRSKIGVSFGRSTTRSGGRALDFFASQVLYLTHLGQESRTISGVKRPFQIEVRAKVDKNKVALPFREAQFNILFGYGVEDCLACLEWLKEVGSLKEVDLTEKQIKTFARSLTDGPRDEYEAEMRYIHSVVERKWYEIEEKFMPKRSKYGG